MNDRLPHTPVVGEPAFWIAGTWLEAAADEPIDYFDELDPHRVSIRCVRRYRGGHMTRHSYADANWRDTMPVGSIPNVAEINLQKGCKAREISAEEFETIWQYAGTASRV